MAKRDSRTKRTDSGKTTANLSGVPPADTLEQRVAAFAEQLGRVVGTVQGKAEGWMDRETLNKQIAGVRDGAADLLAHLAGAVTRGAKKKSAAAAPRGAAKGRSGGAVDAPGKKHRKPVSSAPARNTADSQAAKMRTAKTMVKTAKHRGRG